MVEMVETRRNAETKEDHHDLFNGLLDAARDDLDGNAAITEQELIGKRYLSYRITQEKLSFSIPANMFVFLIAGHEVGPPRSARSAV